MKFNRETLIRVILLLCGLTVAHLGVTLFLQTSMGSDPFNVMIQGLFIKLGELIKGQWLTHGRVHVAVSLLIVAILLIVDRSYIRIGTLLCMLLGGPIIDMFSLILSPLELSTAPLAVRILTLALGCVILAFGMTIVIKSEAGTGPNDLVSVVISDKTRLPFGAVRVGVDVIFVLLGWLLGGVVGVGTLICAFLVGPAAGIFMPYSEKIVKRFVKQ